MCNCNIYRQVPSSDPIINCIMKGRLHKELARKRFGEDKIKIIKNSNHTPKNLLKGELFFDIQRVNC